MGNEERNEEAGQAPAVPTRGAADGDGRDGQAGGAGELFGQAGPADLAEAAAPKIHAGGPKLTIAEGLVEKEWPAVVAVDLSDATRAVIRAAALDYARGIVKNGPKLGRNRKAIFRAWLDGFMTASWPLHWPRAKQTANAARRAAFAAARARREQQSNGIG